MEKRDPKLKEEPKGREHRYMKAMKKFNDFEDGRYNQVIIDEMIKGEKNNVLVPRSGEYFIMKSKNYEDSSLA